MTRSRPTSADGPTYAQLVRELFPRLTGGIRWGTERTERLLAAVGDPQHRFRSIHVGGTNGKGSVSAILASILREAGGPIGLYTSPHLCSFRERVQLDGRPISEAALVAAARRLWPVIQRENPSFFEATTAIAFLALAEAGVEAAVIEVGLGGRLDATNVVTPMVSVLTNVALDHAEYLGGTLEEVAGEKAGIIKPAVPVVTGEADPAIRDLFRRRAEELGAPFDALDPTDITATHVDPEGTRFRLRTRCWGELALRLPLIGAHQARNAALAVRALELLPEERRPGREAILCGMQRVRWPGRLQWERHRGRTWIFDAAHNPAAIEMLVASLRELPVPRPRVAVVGILGDKDWEAMLPPLLEVAETILLTSPPSAPAHRRWDPAAARESLPAGRAEVVEDFDEALAEAEQRAAGGSVLVTGSFHTVGDALCALGLGPWGESVTPDPSVDAPLPGSPSGA